MGSSESEKSPIDGRVSDMIIRDSVKSITFATKVSILPLLYSVHLLWMETDVTDGHEAIDIAKVNRSLMAVAKLFLAFVYSCMLVSLLRFLLSVLVWMLEKRYFRKFQNKIIYFQMADINGNE